MLKSTFKKHKEYSLNEVLQVLLKNIIIIIAYSIIGAGVSLIISYIMISNNPTQSFYKSEATLRVQSSDVVDSQHVLSVLESDELLEEAKSNLYISHGEFSINVLLDKKTDFLNIQLEGSDREVSYKLLNEIILLSEKIILSTVETYKVEYIIEPYKSEDIVLIPAKVNTFQNITLGSTLGFSISLLYILFYKLMGIKVLSKQDIEMIIDEEVIMSLPDFNTPKLKLRDRIFKVR